MNGVGGKTKFLIPAIIIVLGLGLLLSGLFFYALGKEARQERARIEEEEKFVEEYVKEFREKNEPIPTVPIEEPLPIDEEIAKAVTEKYEGKTQGTAKIFEAGGYDAPDVIVEFSHETGAKIDVMPGHVRILIQDFKPGPLTTTLKNLIPGHTYYLYRDSLAVEPEQITADQNGTFSFKHEVSRRSAFYIFEKRQTVVIDETGGDCGEIGDWNGPSKTCVINRNVSDTIVIAGEGITLDGAGRTLSNSGDKTYGVVVDSQERVNVKNLTIKEFSRAITLREAALSRIENINFLNNTKAIELNNSSNNLIRNNTVTRTIGEPRRGLGIFLDNSNDNIIIINSVSNTAFGFNFIDSLQNGFARNTIENNNIGLDIIGGQGEVEQTNFLNNALQDVSAINHQNWDFYNTFFDRGNFWDKHIDCQPQVDDPSLCSNPYPVPDTGKQDLFPWACESGWVAPCPVAPPPPPPGEGNGEEPPPVTREVPLYTQVISPHPSEDETRVWAIEEYAFGRTQNYDCGTTISGCGCAITSIVMIMRYHGATTGVGGVDVNPGKLNEWLKTNNGYTSGNVYWGIAPGFVNNKIKWVAGYAKEGTFSSYTELFIKLKADESLNNQNPVIVQVTKSPSHFFVLDKKLDGTYGVKDPSWYETQTLNDTRSIAKVRNYQNSIDGVRLYAPNPLAASQDILSISLASPAVLLVTDPSGRKTGVDATGRFHDEIPQSSYFTDKISNPEESDNLTALEVKMFLVIDPMPGRYEVSVIGTGNGLYKVGASNLTNNVTDITEFSDNISTNEIKKYLIDVRYDNDIMSSSFVTDGEDGEEGSTPDFKLTPRTFNLASGGVLTAHLTIKNGNINDIVQSSIKLDDIAPIRVNKANKKLIIQFDRKKFSNKPLGDAVEFQLTVRTKNNETINLTDKIRIINNKANKR